MLVDGSRKRRQGSSAKAKWYACYRQVRFQRRFGLLPLSLDGGVVVEVYEITIFYYREEVEKKIRN